MLSLGSTKHVSNYPRLSVRCSRVPNLVIKGTVSVFQVTLYEKMAMPDSQRYLLKICLIEFELVIHV